MLDDLRFRTRAIFRRNVVENELDEELRFHFDRQVEKYMKSGMTEEEARRRARLAFGGNEQAKEDCREARGTGFVELTLQDTQVRPPAAHDESDLFAGDDCDAGAEHRRKQRDIQCD